MKGHSYCGMFLIRKNALILRKGNLISLTSPSVRIIEQTFLKGVPSHKEENVIWNIKHRFMRPYMSDQINTLALLSDITGSVFIETAIDVSYHDFSKTFVSFL